MKSLQNIENQYLLREIEGIISNHYNEAPMEFWDLECDEAYNFNSYFPKANP